MSWQRSIEFFLKSYSSPKGKKWLLNINLDFFQDKGAFPKKERFGLRLSFWHFGNCLLYAPNHMDPTHIQLIPTFIQPTTNLVGASASLRRFAPLSCFGFLYKQALIPHSTQKILQGTYALVLCNSLLNLWIKALEARIAWLSSCVWMLIASLWEVICVFS